MALAGESTLERELVCLAATTAERRPSLFGARCDLSLPPLPCWARCLVRGLDAAMLDEDKRRAGVMRGREMVSLEVDAAAEGVRSEPKAGLAKLAKSRDVDAKTMLMLCGY